MYARASEMNAYDFFPSRCQVNPDEVRHCRCKCVSITTKVHCETVALTPETVRIDLVAGTKRSSAKRLKSKHEKVGQATVSSRHGSRRPAEGPTVCLVAKAPCPADVVTLVNLGSSLCARDVMPKLAL